MRLPQFEQWELLEVHWNDAAAPSEQVWMKPKKKDMEISGVITVGQLYAQSADRLVLVLTRDSNCKNIHGMITILTAAVTSYSVLKRT